VTGATPSAILGSPADAAGQARSPLPDALDAVDPFEEPGRLECADGFADGARDAVGGRSDPLIGREAEADLALWKPHRSASKTARALAVRTP